MKSQNLYCVSDWQSYVLVVATDHNEAVVNTYRDRFRKISNAELTENTLTHAMCCKYEGRLGDLLEN
ncbi:hypothetical protein KIV40_29305, partial [Vibrio sp. D173a]|uniref:hypothetical protein n=1 Tax=Vibrio sp. D173a TaxID=2836349 RepID=UPI002557B730